MNIIRKLFPIWTLFWFITVFLLLFPFFVLFTQKEKWFPKGHFLNKIWAHTVFATCFLPCKIEFRFKPQKDKSYIYCANHSSYMDIPSLCYSLPGYFLFVGKASLSKVPLFGYMFRKLYIPVDRHSKMSRYRTMLLSLAALDKGHSLAIFPEGTIPKNKTCEMIPFKDGPFRMAIEKKVPIVPVTIPYNWIILPDNGGFSPRLHLMKTIVHEPIDTSNLTLDDVQALRDKTFNIIDAELKKQNNLTETKSQKESIV